MNVDQLIKKLSEAPKGSYLSVLLADPHGYRGVWGELALVEEKGRMPVSVLLKILTLIEAVHQHGNGGIYSVGPDTDVYVVPQYDAPGDPLDDEWLDSKLFRDPEERLDDIESRLRELERMMNEG